MSFHAPQEFLISHPLLGRGEGNNGFFVIKRFGISYRIQSSDLEGWEHISVTLSVKRCPTWEEMSWLKNIFWDENDCVIQYHPPKSEYVNYHPFCLHLWKPIGKEIPIPPSIFVGPKIG